MRIAILFGSKSVEHEISIISALQIYNKLKTNFKVDLIYIDKDLNFYKGEVLKEINNYANIKGLKQKAKKITIKKDGVVGKIKYDLFLPILHGTYGEDGNIIGYLNMLNCNYIGNSMKNSIVAHDKYLMKLILEKNNIKTLKYKYISKEKFYNQKDILELIGDMKFPLIIKAVSLGSSIGVKKVNEEEIYSSLQEIFKFDKGVIIEEFENDFIEVNQAAYKTKDINLSMIEEINTSENIYTYEDKYNAYDKYSERNFDLTISEELKNKVSKTTEKVYEIFDLASIVRIDYMVINNELYVNEINIIPGSLATHLFKEDVINIVKELAMINNNTNNYVYSNSLNLKDIKSDKLKK